MVLPQMKYHRLSAQSFSFGKKILLLFFFPLLVLLYDFVRIQIVKFPTIFFVRSSLYYLLLVLFFALILVVVRFVVLKLTNLDVLLAWPILFLIFLRLFVHEAFPYFVNTIIPAGGVLIISAFIIFFYRKRMMSFFSYFFYVLLCYTLFLIFIDCSSLTFLIILFLPALLLFEKHIFRRVSPIAVVFLILLSQSSSASSQRSIKGQSPKTRHNLIFIVVDTARKDCFELEGSIPVTPILQNFSKEGKVLNNFIANGAWTPPAHASMFTGLLPANNGVFHYKNNQGVTLLSDELMTLAEILKQNGIYTQGFYANPMVSDRLGFSQGFDQYVFVPRNMDSIINYIIEVAQIRLETVFSKFFPKIDLNTRINMSRKKRNSNPVALSDEVFKKASQWLRNDEPDQSFFLFINLMEQHHIRHFYDERESRHHVGPIMYTEDKRQLYLKPETVLNKNIALLEWHKLTIRNVDYHLGKFLAFLKNQGLYDNSTIIVTSDHGNLFGEWVHYGHEDNIYAPNVFIPFIVKYANTFNEREIFSDRIFQQVDIFSEILDLYKIPIPQNVYGTPFTEQEHNPPISQLYRMSNIPDELRKILDKDLCGTTLFLNDQYFYLIYSTDGEHEAYKINNFKNTGMNNVYNELMKEPNVQNFINSCPELMRRKIYKVEGIRDKKMLERLKALGYIN